MISYYVGWFERDSLLLLIASLLFPPLGGSSNTALAQPFRSRYFFSQKPFETSEGYCFVKAESCPILAHASIETGSFSTSFSRDLFFSFLFFLSRSGLARLPVAPTSLPRLASQPVPRNFKVETTYELSFPPLLLQSFTSVPESTHVAPPHFFPPLTNRGHRVIFTLL